MGDSKKVLAEAEARVAEWRKTHAQTPQLLAFLRHALQEELFHSAVALRLNTEVLLYEHKLAEASASFYAYRETQHMLLLAAGSGADVEVDAQAPCLALVSDMLTFALRQGGLTAARGVTELEEYVDRLEKVFKEPDAAQFAALRARLAVATALHSQSDGAFQRAAEAGHAEFAKVANPDAETQYAHALLLVLTRGAGSAFAPALAAFRAAPTTAQYALLLAQILSADNQLAPALEVAQSVFRAETPRAQLLLLDRVALLDLKKTQILLEEGLRGQEAALGELVQFIELVADLFEVSAAPKPAPALHPVTSRRHWSLFSRKSAAANGTANGTANGAANGAHEGARAGNGANARMSDENARIVAHSWVWISQQYAKHGFVDDARTALAEAERVCPRACELEGFAEVHGVRGYLETKPPAALRAYADALQAVPTNATAGVGAARALAGLATLTDPQLELAVALSSALESACWRLPARFAPEVWHARGILYEKLGEAADARDALIRAVELEERRGITPYVTIV